jgi:hypothetical protein
MTLCRKCRAQIAQRTYVKIPYALCSPDRALCRFTIHHVLVEDTRRSFHLVLLDNDTIHDVQVQTPSNRANPIYGCDKGSALSLEVALETSLHLRHARQITTLCTMK